MNGGDALSLTHIEVSAKINCNNLHILTYNKIACIDIQGFRFYHNHII